MKFLISEQKLFFYSRFYSKLSVNLLENKDPPHLLENIIQGNHKSPFPYII